MKKHIKNAKEYAKKPINKLRRKKEDILDSTKVPLITNDTIAEQREEVLSGARKYIYPLQHSKHRIIILSSIIFAVTIIAFFAYAILGLYRFQNTSTFMYRVTQIVPFPIARVKGHFVSYENYLFELRHYMHYYETQQKLRFDTEEGQRQLVEFKGQALDRVINDAYVKRLASENGVNLPSQEVEQEIAVVREQNRLGTSDQVFGDVLRDFWGWSVSDFKRSLRQQLLARKVASKLDTESLQQAETALSELKAGELFENVAKKYSEDEATKPEGGEYPQVIDRSNRDIPAKLTEAIFAQTSGQYSDIIDTGYALEIVKTLSFEGDKAKAAHIQFNFKEINEYVSLSKASNPPKQYLKL
ncbi:MAG: SurA N-terminal domain-containing protein [bacterium]|nr:SurA N-terminal domain-containing protein [bacterium]